jgi:acyl-CoA dehydrogenase
MSATYAHLSPEQRQLLMQCEKAARDELSPIAAAGAPGRVNRRLVLALAASGLLPRLFGRGRQISAVELCLIREGLARFSTDAETAFALQGLGAHPILAAGRDEVVNAWIPRVTAGEAVAAIALTEPAAGSDVAALSLAAEHDGDGFRLTGEKVFISNAPDADIYSVFGRTSAGGSQGLTAFAVPRDSAGLSGEVTPLVSDHPIGRLRFDGVPVPASHVLGEVDHGFGVAMRTLNLFRPSVGAAAVGISQAALDAAVAHAAQRTAFGKPLSALQGITHQLAEVATRTQAARLLVHAAAAAFDAGITPVSQAAAMAKLFATETATFAVDVAIQVSGARALARGHPLEHLYRDVRGMRIYEGTSEIQREIIARALFRPG